MLKTIGYIVGVLCLIGSGFGFLLGGQEAARRPFVAGVVIILVLSLRD